MTIASTDPSGSTTGTRSPIDPRPVLAVVVVLLLWASAFIAIRAVAGQLSPGPLALGRLAVAAVVLTVVVGRERLRGRRPTLPRGRAWWPVLGYGVLWFAGYTVVLNAAEHHLDAGTAALLVNVGPLLVAVAAGLLFAEGFPRPLVIGVAIAFVGVLVIAIGGVGGHSDSLGILLGLITAVLYAAGVLTQKRALRTTDPLTATWLGAVIGTLATCPFAPAAVHQLSQASPGAVLATIYLGVFPTAIAFSLWAYALRRTSAGRTATATLAVPAIVVVLSWLLLHEAPTGWAVIGGVLALSGVAISRRSPRPARRPARGRG